MSRKQKRKCRKQRAKTVQKHNQKDSESDNSIPDTLSQSKIPDRFLVVKDIAEIFGVTTACIRKWNTEGKLQLRKLFGSTGPWGIAESELLKLIRGESQG